MRVLKTALLLAAFGAALVSGQDDTNSTLPTPTPVSPGPTPVTPTTTPPGATPSPTPTPKTPAPPSDESSNSSAGPTDGSADNVTPIPTPKSKTPTPTTTPPTAANEAAVVTPTPTLATTSDILLDRSTKSEYGTKTPSSGDEDSVSNSAGDTSNKLGSWLVPSVIGAVVVVALVFVTFLRSKKQDDDYDDDFNPRRSDHFVEHPRTNTNQSMNAHITAAPAPAPAPVPAPVPEPFYPAKNEFDFESAHTTSSAGDIDQMSMHSSATGNSSPEPTSMRTVAVGGAIHSPRDRAESNHSTYDDEFDVDIDRASDDFPLSKTPQIGSSVVL